MVSPHVVDLAVGDIVLDNDIVDGGHMYVKDTRRLRDATPVFWYVTHKILLDSGGGLVYSGA
jgi:hypothetical protein